MFFAKNSLVVKMQGLPGLDILDRGQCCGTSKYVRSSKFPRDVSASHSLPRAHKHRIWESGQDRAQSPLVSITSRKMPIVRIYGALRYIASSQPKSERQHPPSSTSPTLYVPCSAPFPTPRRAHSFPVDPVNMTSTTVKPKTLAMTKATSIPEIIMMILACADRPTLAAASRTCWTWYHIAVEHLWEVLDSFGPLIQLVTEQVRHLVLAANAKLTIANSGCSHYLRKPWPA